MIWVPPPILYVLVCISHLCIEMLSFLYTCKFADLHHFFHRMVFNNLNNIFGLRSDVLWLSRSRLINNTCQTQLQHYTTLTTTEVGFDMKMALQTTQLHPKKNSMVALKSLILAWRGLGVSDNVHNFVFSK